MTKNNSIISTCACGGDIYAGGNCMKCGRYAPGKHVDRYSREKDMVDWLDLNMGHRITDELEFFDELEMWEEEF